MAASSLQPPGATLCVPGSGNAHWQSSSSQQLFWGNSDVVTGSLPAIPGGLGQCHGEELSWKGKSPDALHSHRARQELLWRQYFSNPRLWWDNRQDKHSARSPDFRHRESREVLWLNSLCKPDWVDKQLAALDMQLGLAPSTSNSILLSDPGPRGVAGYQIDGTAETVSRLCEQGQLNEAVQVLDDLVQSQLRVSTSVLYSVLKSCVAQKNLGLGRRVHELVVKAGYESDTFLANHILRMYASHGRLQEATEVFTRVTNPNAFSWSAIIATHAKHGEPQQAINLYQKMRSSSVRPDNHVFVAALQACGGAADLECGRQVHADVLQSGLQPDVFVWNCLVDMYVKCGRLEDARDVFDGLVKRNVVTWNTMLVGYAEHEKSQEVLSLYEQMEVEGVVVPDPVTFTCLLKACARVGDLQKGKQLHSHILERGLEAGVVVGTCLVDMYVKCGRLEDAHRVFDCLPMKDVVTWTAMIAGYAEQGLGQEALALYDRMEQEGLTQANSFTFASLLKACVTVGALQQGKQLHSQILERGLESNIFVGNSLVDMYAKCGRLEEAHKVFEGLATRDVVTWTAMIAGYAEHGLGQEALALYARMQQDTVMLADPVAYACLLKACASAAALQQGKQLHSQIRERGLEAHTVVGTSLVDMYAKCGRLDDARQVFDRLPTKDVVAWNALINGFGQSNEAHKAIECFEEMARDGVQADEATYTCLLVSCSHEGLVKEGRQFFKTMVECGIVPTNEHYACMVDLLGRAGHLDEAEKFLLFGNDNVGFISLLNACKSHGDLERGMRCFESLVSLDSQNAAAYVLMGNLFANAGRWSDVERIERLRKSAGASKKPAVAGIEVDRHVHTFVVGEERGDISLKVRSMNTRWMEEGGHVPHTELVLKQLPEIEKEDELCGHAEKLALAYGLMNTPDGTPLLVTKNLRMCADCHSSTEIMSRIEKREITVRDAHRVHRFVDGSCRCGGRP